MSNIEDTQPTDVLANRVWSGTHWHYPDIQKMIAELARLRAENAALRGLRQTAKVAVFDRLYGTQPSPLYQELMAMSREVPEGTVTREEVVEMDQPREEDA
jgi:hypothetical protein